jgi:protein transport protein HofC
MAIAAERGMPLAPAIAAFATQSWGRTRQHLLLLAESLDSGVSLSRSIRSVPKLLPEDAALLARFGEENGVLPQALRASLAARSGFLPAASSIASRITYLLVVLLTMQTIGGFLTYFVLPKFEAIFKDFNIPLPGATRLIADLFYSGGWFFALAFVLVVAEVTLILLLSMRTLGWTRLRIPGLGRFFRRRHQALILRALSLVIAERKPIEPALTSLARHYPTPWVRSRLLNAEEDVHDGEDWRIALRREGLIRDEDDALLAAAQTSGNLPWAMRELADTSDRRAIVHLQAAIQLFYPLGIVTLGSFVALVAMAYFGPLIRIIEKLTG